MSDPHEHEADGAAANEGANALPDSPPGSARIDDNEERYRILIDSMDVAFCLIEILFDGQGRPNDYRFLEANRAFEEHTGLTSVVGKTVIELVPDHDTVWFQVYGNVALTGEPARYESTVVALNRWFEVYAQRVGPPEKHQVGVFFTDTTVRKRAEDAQREARETLRRSEEQLRDAKARLDAALLAGEIATWTYDISQNSVVADKNMARLFSVDPSAAAGGELGVYLAAIHPEDRPRVSAIIADAIESGDNYEAQYRVVLPDGALRWLVARGVVERDGTGRAISLPGVVVDVTRAVEAEILNRQSEEQYRALFGSMAQGVLYRDAVTQRIISANPAAERILGLSLAQMQGRAVADVEWRAIREDGTTMPLEEFPSSQALATKKAVRGCIQGVFNPALQEIRWMRVDAVPEYGPDETTPSRVYSLFEDITDQRNLQAEQDRLYAVANARAERESFLSDASRVLNASLDYRETLTTVARLLVPRFADWCAIDIVDDSDNLQRLAVEHADPEKAEWGWELNRRYPTMRDEERGIAAVLRTGRSSFAPRLTDEMLTAAIADPERLRLMLEIGFTSVIVVPLLVRENVFGALSLIATCESGREFTEEDLRFAEEVGKRAGLAIENARLFQATTQRAEREALLKQIGSAIRAELSPEAILKATIPLLGQALDADRCYFVRYNQSRDLARASPEWLREGLEIRSIADRNLQMSSFSVDRDRAYKEGKTHIVEDVVVYSPEDAGTLLELDIRSLMRVPIEVGDEMTALAVSMAREPRSWSQDEIRLVENVASLLHSALESALVQQRERNIAQQLQAALQPTPPAAMPGMALSSFYRPALDESSVGGDFFDVYLLREGCTALVVADLSGKGLQAAAQVSTVRNMLRFALYSCQALADAIASLHRILVENSLLTGFATLFVGLYDNQEKSLTYVNCGQEDALIWRASSGDVEQLPPTGPVLGGFIAGDHVVGVVDMSPGDIIFAGTDGMTEVGPNRRKFLEITGLASLFRRCAAAVSADPAAAVTAGEAPNSKQIADLVVAKLIAGVEEYAGSAAGLRDDIALLVGVVT